MILEYLWSNQPDSSNEELEAHQLEVARQLLSFLGKDPQTREGVWAKVKEFYPRLKSRKEKAPLLAARWRFNYCFDVMCGLDGCHSITQGYHEEPAHFATKDILKVCNNSFDNMVTLWHTSEHLKTELPTLLGMTKKEYEKWVDNRDEIPELVLARPMATIAAHRK